jgi:ZIP family zinc transporter/zinc and cadmium transporter
MMLGAATIAGALVTDRVGWLAVYGLAVSAGVTLYVGASNLVPEFQSRHHWRLPLAFFAGCGLYFLSRTAVGL